MDGIIYTAVVYEDKSHPVGIFETKIEIINGISSAPTTTAYDSTNVLERSASDSVTAPARVIDLKFLNDTSLLLLCQAADGNTPPYLICTPFKQPDAAAVAGPVRELAFPENLTAFAPVQMEVLGASDARGEVPVRVSLLGRDRAGCKVFALRGLVESPRK